MKNKKETTPGAMNASSPPKPIGGQRGGQRGTAGHGRTVVQSQAQAEHTDIVSRLMSYSTMPAAGAAAAAVAVAGPSISAIANHHKNSNSSVGEPPTGGAYAMCNMSTANEPVAMELYYAIDGTSIVASDSNNNSGPMATTSSSSAPLTNVAQHFNNTVYSQPISNYSLPSIGSIATIASTASPNPYGLQLEDTSLPFTSDSIEFNLDAVMGDLFAPVAGGYGCRTATAISPEEDQLLDEAAGLMADYDCLLTGHWPTDTAATAAAAVHLPAPMIVYEPVSEASLSPELVNL